MSHEVQRRLADGLVSGTVTVKHPDLDGRQRALHRQRLHGRTVGVAEIGMRLHVRLE